jgi:hypothetical protein
MYTKDSFTYKQGARNESFNFKRDGIGFWWFRFTQEQKNTRRQFDEFW